MPWLKMLASETGLEEGLSILFFLTPWGQRIVSPHGHGTFQEILVLATGKKLNVPGVDVRFHSCTMFI